MRFPSVLLRNRLLIESFKSHNGNVGLSQPNLNNGFKNGVNKIEIKIQNTTAT